MNKLKKYNDAKRMIEHLINTNNAYAIQFVLYGVLWFYSENTRGSRKLAYVLNRSKLKKSRLLCWRHSSTIRILVKAYNANFLPNKAWRWWKETVTSPQLGTHHSENVLFFDGFYYTASALVAASRNTRNLDPIRLGTLPAQNDCTLTLVFARHNFYTRSDGKPFFIREYCH